MIDGGGTGAGRGAGAGIGAGVGVGIGAGGGAGAHETGTSRHTTNSNPITIINLFIRHPPAYYPYYTITQIE